MNEKLVEEIQKAETAYLRDIISQYLAALKDFSSNRDMLLSNMSAMKTPYKSTITSLKYFTLRAALLQACSMVSCPVARQYVKCSKASDECPALVLSNNTDEAALRMSNLDDAKQALFEKYQ